MMEISLFHADKLHTRERFFGSFHRSWSVPEELTEDDVSATYKNGVLVSCTSPTAAQCNDDALCSTSSSRRRSQRSRTPRAPRRFRSRTPRAAASSNSSTARRNLAAHRVRHSSSIKEAHTDRHLNKGRVSIINNSTSKATTNARNNTSSSGTRSEALKMSDPSSYIHAHLQRTQTTTFTPTNARLLSPSRLRAGRHHCVRVVQTQTAMTSL
jgi:hypothetical protein